MIPRLLRRLVCATTILSALPGASCGDITADWSQWRGPNANGSTNTALPTQIDAGRALWRAALPGKGTSTPIVSKDRIYVTAPVGGKDALLAFDLDGKEVWRATFGPEERGKHRNGSGCNPSPVTDGQGIFVVFKSGNFAALNLDGTIRWQTNLVEKFGPVQLFWDYGTSPVLAGDHVVLARLHAGESWLAAFDKRTGEVRWKTARNYETPREVDQSYNTPVVIRHENRQALLTWGAEHVTLHDAENGRLLWSCGDFNPGANSLWPSVASPVVAGDVAVVCFGRADKGQPRLHGVRLGGRNTTAVAGRIWQREDTAGFVPTPAEYKGRVYVLSDRGQLDCIDPQSGKSAWSASFPRASSNYYASPLVANGVLYAVREDGAMFVARVDDSFKILSETKFSDRVLASAVPAGSRLLVRGEANLYCFAD